MKVKNVAVTNKEECLEKASELKLMLSAHPAVLETEVISRVNSYGNKLAIAYVVPTDIHSIEKLKSDLAATLAADQLPDEYVMLTALPVSASGDIDRDALTELEVIDSELSDRWKKAISGVDGVHQVEMVAVEQKHQTGKLHHRLDLLPDVRYTSHSDVSKEITKQKTSHDTVVESGTSVPAIIQGVSLVYSEEYPQTLSESLRRTAEKHDDHGITYVRRNGTEHFQSYPELLLDAETALKGLLALGCNPGDKIILQLNDNCEFLIAFWACVLGGMVPVPISIAPDYSPANATAQKLINVWNMLDRPLVLSSQDLTSKLKSVFGSAGAGRVDIESLSSLEANKANVILKRTTNQPDDLALLLLTSGSTGVPKAVMHNQLTLLNRSASSAAFNNFNSKDVSLNWMPLDHVGGIVMFHLRDVFAGCSQVQVATEWVLEKPLRWLDLIERYKATITWAPNFAYALINDRAEEVIQRHWDLSSMRFILNGGEAVVAKTSRHFLRLLKPHELSSDCMYPAWGMSETASAITYSHNFSLENSSDNDITVEVGGPIPNTALRITNENNELLHEGVKGNLQVRGSSITPGYYNNPEVNKNSFTEDAWFNTGDVGYLLNGKLTVTARTKDDIIINGINYIAAEIEQITDSITGVETSYSAACAVRRPNSDTDELAIFFNPGSNDQLAALLGKIRENVTVNIGIRPTCLVPLEKEQIPKTNIGKIQRTKLKNKFENSEFDNELKQADLLIHNNTIPDWFFKKEWCRKEIAHQSISKQSGPSLVFLDKSGLGLELSEQLRINDNACITVESGMVYKCLRPDHYVINPAKPEHYIELVLSLSSRKINITQIIHCCTYETDTKPVTELKELMNAQQYGVYSILHLVQALVKAKDNENEVGLYVVSNKAQTISNADRSDCKHSTVTGLLKTIPLEINWLHCRHIDLDTSPIEQNVKHIINETTALTKDDEVAYRNGHRYCWRLIPVDFSQQPTKKIIIKHGGIYLITGGLGGIGAWMAKVLMRDYNARLVLIGTTALPDRSSWPSHLKQEGKLADRIRQYQEIESIGGELTYEAVDVSDHYRLKEIIEKAETTWQSKLSGILHLAVGGDLGDYWNNTDTHYLRNETRASFEQMFCAKVYGSWVLTQLAETRPDSILITFGSVIGVFGASRYGAYASAHTYLSNLMLQQHYHVHSLSYNFAWAVWDQIGLSKAEPAFMKDYYRSIGYMIIPKQSGLDSLMAGLYHDKNELIIGLDPNKWSIRKYLTNKVQPLQKLVALIAMDEKHKEIKQELKNIVCHDEFGTLSQTEYRYLSEIAMSKDGQIDRDHLTLIQEDQCIYDKLTEPSTETERQIAAIWCEVLAITLVDVRASFFLLGGNSLNATQVLSRIREKFQIKLDTSDLFQHATIYDLAKLVDLRMGGDNSPAQFEISKSMDPETLLENIEQLSDKQVAELLSRIDD